MSYTSGKVGAPVSISDVRHALGVSGTDVGTLCASAKINMWAKYKPVVWPEISTLKYLASDGATWNASHASPWWKATDGNYGLSYADAKVSVSTGASGMITALDSLAGKVDGGLNGWSYAKPSGGASSPYRLLDFLQYNHNASSPFKKFEVGDVVSSDSAEYSVQASFIRTDGEGVGIESRDYIVPEDITGATLYMGIAIYKKLSDGTISAMAWTTDDGWRGAGIKNTSATDGVLATGATQVTAQLKDGQTYYALPFYSLAELAQPSAGASANPTAVTTVIAVPYCSMTSFKATRRATTQVIGRPVLSMRKVIGTSFSTTLYLDSTAEGYGGGTATVAMSVVNESYNGTLAEGNYAFNKNYGSVTVGSSEKKEVGSTGTLTLSSGHTWRVIVTVNGEATTFALIQAQQVE